MSEREWIPVELVRDALAAWSDLASSVVSIEPIPRGATADVFRITTATDGWVAKYAYDYREPFEAGLRASALLAGAVRYDVAAPLLTDAGEYSTMVEWPPASPHPLAVLRWVGGAPLAAEDDDGPEVMGAVCGAVHRALLDVDATSVGLAAADCHAVPPIGDSWDLGANGWLNETYEELGARAEAVFADLRRAVSVWDGPDIRVDRGAGDRVRIALLDFGHTNVHPLVHVVANRALIAAYTDHSRVERFRGAVEQHLSLTAAEDEAFDLYRMVNATIYARWATAHPSPSTTRWLTDLLETLDDGLPRLGLTAGPR